MGNPEAAIKIIEFASLTCSHCADFSENGFPALRDKYVNTGKVSYELRNFVRDPLDMTAALLARCAGAEPFFSLSEQRSEEHTSELQSLMRISYAVFCLKKKNKNKYNTTQYLTMRN